MPWKKKKKKVSTQIIYPPPPHTHGPRPLTTMQLIPALSIVLVLPHSVARHPWKRRCIKLRASEQQEGEVRLSVVCLSVCLVLLSASKSARSGAHLKCIKPPEKNDSL